MTRPDYFISKHRQIRHLTSSIFCYEQVAIRIKLNLDSLLHQDQKVMLKETKLIREPKSFFVTFQQLCVSILLITIIKYVQKKNVQKKTESEGSTSSTRTLYKERVKVFAGTRTILS